MTSKLKAVSGGPEPLRTLGTAGRAFWDRTVREYGIADSAGLDILQVGASATDRAEFCRETIEREGMTIVMASGAIREHPLIKSEAAALGLVLRCIRQLGIDLEPTKTMGRPSGLASGWRGY